MATISNEELAGFYGMLMDRCDDADREKDQFIAMAKVAEIEKLIADCNKAIPYELRTPVLAKVTSERANVTTCAAPPVSH